MGPLEAAKDFLALRLPFVLFELPVVFKEAKEAQEETDFSIDEEGEDPVIVGDDMYGGIEGEDEKIPLRAEPPVVVVFIDGDKDVASSNEDMLVVEGIRGIGRGDVDDEVFEFDIDDDIEEIEAEEFDFACFLDLVMVAMLFFVVEEPSKEDFLLALLLLDEHI